MVCVTGRGWCRLQWFAELNKIGYFESWFEEGKLQLGVWAVRKLACLIGWGSIIAGGRDKLRLSKVNITSAVIPSQPINLN